MLIRGRWENYHFFPRQYLKPRTRVSMHAGCVQSAEGKVTVTEAA